MKTVEETFHIAYEETLKIIPKTLYSFKQANNEGVLKEYYIKPEEFENSLRNKFGNYERFSKIFTDHLLGQKNIIAAFASAPTSFSDAWNMKSEELIAEDVLALQNQEVIFSLIKFHMDQINLDQVFIKIIMQKD